MEHQHHFKSPSIPISVRLYNHSQHYYCAIKVIWIFGKIFSDEIILCFSIIRKIRFLFNPNKGKHNVKWLFHGKSRGQRSPLLLFTSLSTLCCPGYFAACWASLVCSSAFRVLCPPGQKGEGPGVKPAPKPYLDRWGCACKTWSRSVHGFGFPLALHIPTDRQTNKYLYAYFYKHKDI